MPTRAANMKRLHALGAKAGLDHAALRYFTGAASLAVLSDAQLADACARLQREVPDRPYKPRAGTRRAAKGTLRLATPRQRHALIRRAQDMLAANTITLPTLFEHFQRDLSGAWHVTDWKHALLSRPYSSAAVSAVITRLDQIAKHRQPGWRKGVGSAVRSAVEVPSV